MNLENVSMSLRLQFGRRAALSIRAFAKPAAFLLGLALLAPAALRAQLPAGTIGQVEGKDISVEGGTPVPDTPPGAAIQNIFVANGGIVTVHSGQARLTLLAGGHLDICGPAKFTLLQTGAAVTVALNFGRLRVQLPAGTSLRIFTPTIIATPLDIGGGPRDVNVGLELNDSLCVLAASGALRLEHQFTGEGLIVPQSGEFFLAGGKLVPVAGTPGSCLCAEMHPTAAPLPAPSAPIPRVPGTITSQTQLVPPPDIKSELNPSAKADLKPSAPPPKPQPEPPVQLAVLAHANEIHPTSPPKAPEPPPPPPVSIPEYKIIMPPLTFAAGSNSGPAAPPDSSPELILLVRTARVQPEFEFTGRVEAPPARIENAALHPPSQPPPPSKPAKQKSPPKSASAQPPQQPQTQSAAKPEKKKGGFWSSLKRIFGGNS
ncbi:MAG TPA: hypothetical protein VEU52_01990 [Candidatus Limnocylindrales bacterium]|nr:hypothetical protein [Candidatus Limnocylindrales bacterium]